MNQSGKKITAATARAHTRKSKNNTPFHFSSREQVESSQVRRLELSICCSTKRSELSVEWDVSKALAQARFRAEKFVVIKDPNFALYGSYLQEQIEMKPNNTKPFPFTL
ncbi:hypothetical protein MTR67_049298 [Solanum verrucosum]|uniref:Uncharacterized protein n=1 Tax=Solanum verrucosum TaxID=315347 RepID=A0AAF0UZF7_SOLVR|nr:hypothetical protein MTR67_049298 [Solanum verrucosum]